MDNPYADLVPKAASGNPYADLVPGGTTQDVIKSAEVAPVKAAIGIFGLPGDIRQLTDAARAKLESYLPAEPEFLKKAEALARVANPISYLSSLLPNSGSIRQGVESVTGPLYDPQTRAGKVADTGVQTALMMGRNWLTNPLASGAITAGITAGTEGAGAATGDNPYARALGGLLGGGVPAAVIGMRSKPGAVVKDALGPMTQQDIDRAIQMQEQAKAAGVPLLGTESLDRGHQLASAVYASPSGNQTIDNFLRQRPAQVRQAVESQLISQTGPRATPTENAARAQQAATAVIHAAEDAVSAQSGPLYRAAAKDQVPRKAIEDIINQAQGIATADKTKIVAPTVNEFVNRLTTSAGSPAVPGTPGRMNMNGGGWEPGKPSIPATPPSYITDIENLDRARKYFRDKMDLPAFAAEAIPKEAAGKLTGLNVQLGNAMEQSSPTFANARALHQQLSRQNVEPLLSGDIGRIAGRGFDPAAYPPVPRVTSTIADSAVARPDTIRDLYTRLNPVDKQAFPGIVQTHIENQLNSALADIRSGANPTAGAKLRQALVGTLQDKANFDEMMRGVAQANGANQDQVVRGAHTLLDVLERTGRTPGIGSQTAPRSDIAKELGKTLTGDVMQTISLTPTRPLARRFNDFISRGRYAGLAEALTAPDSVQRLTQLAKLQPDTLTASYLVAAMLGIGKINASGQ